MERIGCHFHFLRQLCPSQEPIAELQSVLPTRKAHWNEETIHLFMSLNGKKHVERMLNTMKTVLYYQNRVQHDDPWCFVSIPKATVLQCPRHSTATLKRPFHLHLIADSQSRPNLHLSLSQWGLQGVNWTLYSLERHWDKVDWIPNEHWSGISALIKLTLTTIIPENVEKVIAMDIDVILNHDIAELWNHFDQFSDKQIFGYAWEQNSDWPKCNEPNVDIIPKAGINGGLALLYLSRMRQLKWDHLWFTTLIDILEERGKLRESDQEVIREVILRHPELYYRVPCEWNVQVYARVASECLPRRMASPLPRPDRLLV
ncbi:Glycosyltransferase protein LARGE [Fasciola gigantica]|uniref:Glycosyltransferase protein LARGE n=1 Tax=Fasciola gigantica TaxID=46835 RepID=A0A504Y8Y3_FASGI|nr:Glycosyltransferase protein LARGE [Fasciola gigantica]